jgi:hypothetical protein
VGILVAAGLLAAGPGQVRALWSSSRVRTAAGVTGAIVALAVVYTFAGGVLNAFTGFAQPGLSHLSAAQHSLARFPQRARDMVGVFGWGDTHLPRWLTDLWLLAAGVLAATALAVGRWRQRIALLATMVTLVVVPVGSEALRAPSIGFVWQGRYSLPLAIGVPLLSGWVLASSDRFSRRPQLLATYAVIAGTAGALLWSHAVWMSRNMAGLDHPVLSYLTSHGWHPPLPAWALGTAMLAAVVAYGCWSAMLARELAEPSGSSPPGALSRTGVAPPTARAGP